MFPERIFNRFLFVFTIHQFSPAHGTCTVDIKRSIFLHFSEHKGFSFVSDHVSIRQVKSQSISYLHNEPVAADTSNSHKLLTAIPANKPFHRQHETRTAFCTGALAHDLLVQCTVCQVCECLLTSLLAGRQQFGRAYPG